MKYRVSELEGELLDLAVARAIDLAPIPGQPVGYFYWMERGSPASGFFNPSSVADQGLPVLDDARITTGHCGDDNEYWPGMWFAEFPEAESDPRWVNHHMVGPTRLIAGLRCFLHSKFGDEVDL